MIIAAGRAVSGWTTESHAGTPQMEIRRVRGKMTRHSQGQGMGVAQPSRDILERPSPPTGLARFPADPVQRRPRLIDRAFVQLLPAILPLIASPLAIGTAMLGVDEHTEHVVVIAPPWYDPRETVDLVARAGGRLVDMAGFGGMVVATRGEGESRQAFLDALGREGAWLTLDAGALRGCVTR